MIGSSVTLTLPSMTSLTQTNSRFTISWSRVFIRDTFSKLPEEESHPRTDELAAVAYHSPFVIN
ncbi:hypothetical protein ALC53_09639 [Atta colombica]|uniref:Uncharacterized protein n=1 Tax=Atta colombica TaxID=520822 RepID=A0A151I255_9HYME|nr:hypothetical protein ALC53_09639 [Atta colombica]